MPPRRCKYWSIAFKRKLLLNGEIYHVFNRSIAKENIFSEANFADHALKLINYYRFHQRLRYSRFRVLKDSLKHDYWKSILIHKPLIDIFAFCLMPNHFHFLVMQSKDKGIIRFLSNFQNSFAKYYNIVKSRTGGLFQDKFKAKRITCDEEFIHVARYIHLNPVTSWHVGITQLINYPYTSYCSYVNPKSNTFISTDRLLSYFKSIERFTKFIADQVDYQRRLHEIKKLI